jgi:hypothetical protein
LDCDNRRRTALSHCLHTKKYAAQCSALSGWVLATQWVSRGSDGETLKKAIRWAARSKQCKARNRAA